MTRNRKLLLLSGLFIVAAGAAAAWPILSRAASATVHHRVPAAGEGKVVVQLCDGVTALEVKGLAIGQKLTPEQARRVSGQLMAEWRRKHPDEEWQMAQAESAGTSKAKESAGGGPAAMESTQKGPGEGTAKSAAAALPAQQGDTYASFTSRDHMLWQAETDKFVEEGKAIFHDANKLGSTIGMSCDMCHPDAANTHPETYPKYQVQLQRVALLRDMINWCIENPVKGAPLDDEDRRLRALEAYILAQRKGVPLAYGKH